MTGQAIGQTIAALFQACGLGKVTAPILPVSGGFLHRMYRVDAGDKTYAVKHLNPEVIKRPDAMARYRQAEVLEEIIEKAGIPIVPALVINGSRMQEQGGAYFYIFRWQEGQTTDWDHITAAQCRMAGNIQGRIHAIEPRKMAHKEPEMSAVDWAGYIEEARRQDNGIETLLRENEALLNEVQDALNRARLALPDIECITDEDMDPKNVMWEEDRPVVIDLECLDYGNPVSHVLQLSLQWAGITTCSFDPGKLRAFFEGYLEAYDNGFRDYERVFGVAYTWIEWLEYNITRALGNCQDERERETGILEVKNTIDRIAYLRRMEDRIRQELTGVDSWNTNTGQK